MNLAGEIESQITVDEKELREKATVANGVNNSADLLLWATEHVFGPVLKQHQDAILRLAREIEELKGN